MNSNSKYPIPIGELAKQLSITTRTIRYYEEIGLMPEPQRMDSGVRVYGREEVLRLKFILKLKELGITLHEMHELAEIYRSEQSPEKVMPRLVQILDTHIAQIDGKLSRIAQLRADLATYRHRVAELGLTENP
ncbi:MAG: MerR family transcriptional regulator [bacterium]|nr:MerR family transcriptional regulator [bacterium]